MVSKYQYHGLSYTPEYKAWQGIKERCLNMLARSYKDYGGRGITIYEPWVTDFLSFLHEVGNRPALNMSIERIHNNKGYIPGNVKWATKGEQQRNTRRARLITYNGETKNAKDWAAQFGINYNTFMVRLHRGWTMEDMVRLAA